MNKVLIFVMLTFLAISLAGISIAQEDSETGVSSVFEQVCSQAETEPGGTAKLISYEKLQRIKASGEQFVLVDVLGEDSYSQGHIPGAVSLPLGKINEETAGKIADNNSNIIVYCGSFKCKASTRAAEKLQSLGYAKVLDYKGGLMEYVQKGNELEK